VKINEKEKHGFFLTDYNSKFALLVQSEKIVIQLNLKFRTA